MSVNEQVEGLIRLMEGEHVGPFNLGNPGEFTMLELAQVDSMICACNSIFVFQFLLRQLGSISLVIWAMDIWNPIWCRWSKRQSIQMRRLNSDPTQKMTHTRGNRTSQRLNSFWAGSHLCPFAMDFLSWFLISGSAFLGIERKLVQSLLWCPTEFRVDWRGMTKENEK